MSRTAGWYRPARPVVRPAGASRHPHRPARHVRLLRLGADLLRVLVHCLGVGREHKHRGTDRSTRANGTKDVNGIMPGIAHHYRPRADRALVLPFHPASPDGSWLRLEPDLDRRRCRGLQKRLLYQCRAAPLASAGDGRSEPTSPASTSASAIPLGSDMTSTTSPSVWRYQGGPLDELPLSVIPEL
jgi:hypothetical protein